MDYNQEFYRQYFHLNSFLKRRTSAKHENITDRLEIRQQLVIIDQC